MLVSYPRFGTLSMINLVFGLLMVIFGPWMTLAIIISGVLADSFYNSLAYFGNILLNDVTCRPSCNRS
ncbi:hypothetical protein [Clostridium estertheticum]|uniref:hypothetical protein n=1 Tax=Clostridium estertheticum TaxID=238834 RepID=UPI001C0AA5D4|nr:hypothetical protein [Clostridium estertheticum]MBU3157569.1 hypothetical protein [Clostridium estertheticum]